MKMGLKELNGPSAEIKHHRKSIVSEG